MMMVIIGNSISIISNVTGDVFYYISVVSLVAILAYFFTKAYSLQKKGQFEGVRHYKKIRISREESIIMVVYNHFKYVYFKSGQAMVLMEKVEIGEDDIENENKTLYFKGVLNRYLNKKKEDGKTGKGDYEEK